MINREANVARTNEQSEREVTGGGQDGASGLLGVVLAALGPGYASALPEGVLTGSNRGPSRTSVTATPRLLVGRAAAAGGGIDIDMGTNLTIWDAILSRTFQVRPLLQRWASTAEMFQALGPRLLCSG